MTKTYFDKSYKSLKLVKESNVYLRLHHEYEISDIDNRKLYYQRVGSFKILEKIEKLVYRLELPSVILIYFVVSIV